MLSTFDFNNLLQLGEVNKHLCYLPTSEESLDQRTHDLLRGTGRADVRQDEVTVGLLGIADPTCNQRKDAYTVRYYF